MKKLLKIVFWSAVAGHLYYFCETAKAQKSDAEKIYKKVTGSVLTLYTHDALCNNIGQGSGVVIDKKGLVITNFHLIQGGQHIIVKHEDSIIYDVVILGFDLQKDMMLLKIPEKTFRAVTMANSDKVQVGEKVFSVGSPKGYQNTITEGIVSGIRKSFVETRHASSLQNSMSYIQVSCPLSPGSSGGAIVNAKGELIGISTYVSVSATNAQNLNFAIPVNAFDELINQDHEDKFQMANYYLQLGIYEFNRGQYKTAINYLKKVTIFEPQNFEAFLYLGYAYYQTGNSELMLHYLTAAVENNEQISMIADSGVTEIYK
ncbi:MAG: trypsin-like peptidase domain-containing protein, partial [Bacteroidetes bacterium]|nr:trypsin-like peptidase domain-containing protein [Bacteroidota bacterium]